MDDYTCNMGGMGNIKKTYQSKSLGGGRDGKENDVQLRRANMSVCLCQ